MFSALIVLPVMYVSYNYPILFYGGRRIYKFRRILRSFRPPGSCLCKLILGRDNLKWFNGKTPGGHQKPGHYLYSSAKDYGATKKWELLDYIFYNLTL